MAIFTNDGSGSDLTPQQLDAINSIINLTENTVPRSSDPSGTLIESFLTYNPATDEYTIAKTLNVPQGSLMIGTLAKLSEGGGFLITRNPIFTDEYFALIDSRTQPTGSKIPRYLKLGAEATFDIQLVDTTIITTNPLTFSVTSIEDAQFNDVVFKANGAMTNTRIRIVDNATGIVIKFLPNQLAWDTGTNGIDFISGLNTICLTSEAPSTPGQFNVGITPFRLLNGQQMDIEVRADSVDLLGDATDFPFLQTTFQAGVFTDIVEQEGPGVIQAAPNASETTFYALRDSNGTVGWSTLLRDNSPGDPTIEETALFGKTLKYNGGDSIDITHYNNEELDYEHEGATPGYNTVSHSIATENVGYKVYGLGNQAATNSEYVSLEWNADDSIYRLQTRSAGTGVRRTLDISNTNLIQTPAEGDVLDQISNINIDDIQQVAVIDGFAYAACADTQTIPIINVSDPKNISIAGSISNAFATMVISLYSADDFNESVTVITINNGALPENGEIIITGATGVGTAYNGTHIVTNVTATTMQIQISFAGDPGGGNRGIGNNTNFDNGKTIKAIGDALYWMSNNRLLIFDKTDPLEPVLIGNLVDSRIVGSNCIIIAGKTLFMAGNSNASGLVAIDVSDLTFPKFLGQSVTSNRYVCLDVRGNRLYSGNNSSNEFEIWDVSDPTDFVIISSLANISFDELNDVLVNGTYAYMVDGTGSLYTITIEDETAPVLVSVIPLAGASSNGPLEVTLSGNYLYITNRDGDRIHLIDITIPNVPIEVNDFFVSVTSPRRLTLVGDIMYISEGDANTFKTVQVRGFTSHASSIGTLESDTITINKMLDVFGGANFSRSVNITGGFNVSGKASVNGRELFGSANNIVHISEITDFPAPVGNLITLEPNTNYVLFNSKPEYGIKFIDSPFEFNLPEGSLNASSLTSESLGSVILRYTGTNAMFNSSKAYSGFFSFVNIFCACPNGTLFDIDATLPAGFEFFPRLSLQFCGFFQVKNIGTIRTISFNYTTGSFFGVTGGSTAALTFIDMREAVTENVRFTDWVDNANTVVIRVQGDNSFFRISGSTFDQGANSSLFNIDPLISSDNELLISNNQFQGEADVYEVLNKGVINTILDSSTAASVTSVVNSGGLAQFIGTGFDLGFTQEIIMSGFTEPLYNGTFLVGSSNATMFVITDFDFNPILFQGSTDTGSYTADSVIVTVDVTTGINSGAVVNILGTVSYDGGARIFKEINDTSFDIARTFTTGQSPTLATWNDGSLQEDDPRVLSVGNAGIKNTIPIGAMTAQDITDETVIGSQGLFFNLNLNASGDAIGVLGNNRWVLSNEITGEQRYDGIEDISPVLTASITASSSGGTQEFAFQVLINGMAVPNVVASQDLSSSAGNVTLIAPIEVSNGDFVRIAVANLDGTSNLTIRRITVLIQ